MNSFFIEFRDPLFSIIIFFTIIFVITFFSYWWGRYKKKENSRQLGEFLAQFRTPPSHDELKVLIAEGGLPEKSWLLLANAYYKNGDYEKSIEIYNEILKSGNKNNARETMFLLGKTYFKAGFLERSKQVFLEILKNNPRTPEALRYLLLVYEYMKDYKSALEVLDPLDELKEETKLESAYLQALDCLESQRLTKEEKVQRLLDIYQSSQHLVLLVFDYLFKVNPALAWENLDSSKSDLLTELFWRCDSKDLNLDIITNNGYLRELYSARGDVKLASDSRIFEFDVLIGLQGKSNATLSFEYVCDNCKGTYPFAFNRCSSCHAIDTARVEFSLSKDYSREYSEENNSFQ